MNKEEQRQKAEAFQAMHRDSEILLLANAWDVISAKIYEQVGFKAIGTTSAGIAAVLGYPDGQIMTLDENLEMVRRIVESTQLPMSADLEAGYAESPEGVVESVRSALATGAVGMNLEDSTGDESKPLYDIANMIEKISAVREIIDSTGIPLVINLRTDVYLLNEERSSENLQNTVKRANAYREAGADCIFVPDMPGTLDRETIATLVKEIEAPVNIIISPEKPTIAELQELGVARVSFGPRFMRVLLAQLGKISTEVLTSGTYIAMSADAMSYSEINSMLSR